MIASGAFKLFLSVARVQLFTYIRRTYNNDGLLRNLISRLLAAMDHTQQRLMPRNLHRIGIVCKLLKRIEGERTWGSMGGGNV